MGDEHRLFGVKKKRTKRRPLRPGEPQYIAESLKPGTKKTEAARRAGLDYVPGDKRIERTRRRMLAGSLTAANARADEIVREVVRVGRSDIRKVFKPDGTLKQIVELDDDTAAAISSFDVERRTRGLQGEKEVYYVMQIRFWNKNQANEMLMKYRKMLSGAGDDTQKDRLDELVRAIQESPK